MALETHETNVGAYQHPRIRRAVRLMTRLATLKTHGRMFERERPALVAMAFEAARLIRRKGLLHGRPDAAVGIVAIHAAHVAFRKFVMKRPLEFSPLVQVAAGAQLVRRVGLANHQRLALMHLMASGTRNLVVGVAAFEAANLRRLIQMAGETDFVGRGGRKIRWILDVIGRGTLGVLLAGTMTGFALASLPSLLCINRQCVMCVFGQPVVDVFVTGHADLGARVTGWKRGGL